MASSRGPDNSVRVAIQGNLQGVNWANVFHAQLTTSSSISQSDLDTWLTAFQNAFKTRFSPRQQGSVNYVLARAVLYTPGGGELLSQIAMSGVGTSGATLILDTSCAKVISWLSTVYWRGGKPRTYITGVGTSETSTGNTLTNAEVTALTTAATNFRNDINALTSGTITGTSLGFVSFHSGNVARPAPLFFAFTGAKVHPRFGTQRRRLGRWTA